jgi:hypothetical protein
VKSPSLTFKAGPGALDLIRRHGFDPSCIGTIAGASGGAKWLVLSRLDKAILTSLVPKMREPVHLIGTSIGAWRFACYAQNDPLAAIDRFETVYVEQSYSAKPDAAEISGKSRDIIDTILGTTGAREVLNHPLFRSHVLAVRSKRITASENRWLLGLGLAGAATMNLISRKTLGLFFERALFHDVRERPPFFDASGFPLQTIALTTDNLADAIVATGSIPLVMSGVADIHGAAPGLYRDGGLIDYHHDLQHSTAEKLTLFPHFYDYLVPGWFDKKLTWRRPQPQHVDRTIVVSPSADFVSRLPYGKIPDRQDFLTLSPTERIAAWRKCVIACDELADDFTAVIENDKFAERLVALYQGMRCS